MSSALILFRPTIIPNVPGCPDFVIENAVLLAAREFCKDTRIWQDAPGDEEVLIIDVAGEDIVYALTVPEDSNIIGIAAVLRNESPMSPGIEYALDVQTASVIFAYAPSPEDEIKVRRVYKPARTAATVPDFLYNEFEEAISNKALSDLVAMPGKPWTNLALVGDFRQKYQSSVHETISRAMKGGTIRSLSVRPKEFGFTGSDKIAVKDPTLQFD